jgi:hypothetical protein
VCLFVFVNAAALSGSIDLEEAAALVKMLNEQDPKFIDNIRAAQEQIMGDGKKKNMQTKGSNHPVCQNCRFLIFLKYLITTAAQKSD